MILGTSKISLILGPIIGHFWALEPRIYTFSYTKILQQILESIWEHLGKYYSSKNENQQSRKRSKGKPPWFFGNYCLYIIFEYIF